MIKRLFAVLLALAMSLSWLPAPAHAETVPTITPGSAEGYPGNQVFITLRGENLENLGSVDLEVYYDADALTVEGTATDELFGNSVVSINRDTPGIIKISLASVEGVSGTGNAVGLWFRINDGCPAGDYTVQCTVGDAYSTSLTETTLKGGSGKITVLDYGPSGEPFQLFCGTATDTVQKGDSWFVDAVHDENQLFASADFTVEYDPDLLQVDSVTLSDQLAKDDAVYSVNTNISGVVRISYAATTQARAGQLFTVNFTVIGNTTAETEVVLSAKEIYRQDLSAYADGTAVVYLHTVETPEVADHPDLWLQMPEYAGIGDTFTTPLMLQKGSGVAAADFALQYDPTVFQCQAVTAADGLGSLGGMAVINPNFENGTVKFSYVNESAYSDQDFAIVNITWKTLGAPREHSRITLSGTGVCDTGLQDLQLDYVTGEFCICDPVITYPTCTQPGITGYACACGKTYPGSQTDPLGHTGGQADCKHLAVCTRCGESYGELDETAHVGGQANCTELAVCAVCGAPYGEVNTTVHAGGQANCVTLAQCIRCGQGYGEVDPLCHTGNTELRNEKQPTCTEEGNSGDTYCADCGVLLKQGLPLPVTHSYEARVVPATYTKQGYTEHFCPNCGDSYQDAYTKAKGLPKPAVKAANDPVTGGALLTWTHDGEADSYKVYRATKSSGSYTLVATVTEAQAKVSVPVGKKYYFKVYAVCAEDSKLSSGYSSVVNVTGVCAQPQVSITQNSAGKPYLSWSKVSGAEKYYIYRVDASGNRTSLGSTTNTNYTDTKAAVGTTYTYQVRTYGSKSAYHSAYSESVSCLCICGQPALSAAISAATGKPTLSWKAISGAVSYDIYRSANGTDFELLTNQTGTSYADASAAPDTDYWYKVNALGASEELNSIEGAVKKVHATLAKPNVTFSNDGKTGKPKLSWDAIDGAVSYKIYRSSYSTKKYKLLKTVTSTEYIDTSVSVAKGYYYKVIAVGENVSSAYSAYKKLTAKCAQPQVSITQNSAGKPYLSWSKVSGAEKYYIYRVDASGNRTSLGSTTNTNYTDTKAAVGTTYTYQVRTYGSKSAYHSAYSESVSCLCICGQPALSVSVNAATGKPTLSWKAISGAVSYDIYRSANGTDFELLTNQTGTSYADASAAPDTDYWYKVNALGAREELNSVEGAAKKVHATLAKPNVTFSIDGKTGKPKLSWDAIDGAVSYKIYRSSKSTKSYKVVKTVTATEYIDTSVSVGKGYYYKVIAVGENVSSAYSAYKKLTAKCAQPQVSVTTNTSGKPYLSWSKVSGAKKYYIYRVDASGNRTSLGSTTKTYFADSAAVLGTTYTYQVRTYGSKSAYHSAYSESVSCLCICAQPSVTLTVVAATGKPTLSWKAVTGAVSYELYRSVNDGEYQLISTQTELSYLEADAVLDSKYSYKVKVIAEDPMLNNESAAKSVYCSCGNPTVTGKLNGKKPMVSWEAVEGATQYHVYRSTKSGSGYKKVATTTGLSYTDKKATKGKTYYYKVIAATEVSSSAYSNYVKLKSK